MGKMNYKAALYMRLSKDDKGAVSSSIQSQRSLLRAYAREQGFDIFGEYVDDGWSGTNFDRPEFLHMLSDIEAGHVNLVLTKDLSRLGRDYIGAGRYTEIYFPSRGVRYVAVSDGYDSMDGDSDLIPFKHVMNEMYARDISRKIRSALGARMGEGAYIGNFAPYGYQKDPSDRGHLIPDPETAPVVKMIFEAAASEEEFRAAGMAAKLDGKGILPPALYRCRTHPELNPDNYTKSGRWTANTVIKILHNPVYLGHLVQGKYRKSSFRSRKVCAREPEDYSVALHTHEAIVSREVFEAADRKVSRKPSKLLAAVDAYAWQWASAAMPRESLGAESSIPPENG